MHKKTISSSPQRNICCYGQWQSACSWLRSVLLRASLEPCSLAPSLSRSWLGIVFFGPQLTWGLCSWAWGYFAQSIMQYLRIIYSIVGYDFNSKQVANLPPEDRHLYENSLRITKTKDNLGVDRIKGFKEVSVLK